VRGTFTNAGKTAAYSSRFVLVGSGSSTPRVWEKSVATRNVWKKEPFDVAGMGSFAPELCSVLLMQNVGKPTNVPQMYADGGSARVSGHTVRFVRVTAGKPGAAFEYDWYIDPSSLRVLRLGTAITDAAPSTGKTSETVTFTYSAFNEPLKIFTPS
jgi:hypothetical protein